MRLSDKQKKLVEANVFLVPFVVKKYLALLDMDFEDMVSVGYYGLCRAALCFNPSRNCTFSTYATKVIIATIKRDIEYNCRLKRGGGIKPVSIDAMEEDAEDGESTEYFKYIWDRGVNVEAEAINNVLYSPIWKLAPVFYKLQKRGMLEKELGKELGISGQAVNLRKKTELKKVKQYIEKYGIKDVV